MKFEKGFFERLVGVLLFFGIMIGAMWEITTGKSNDLLALFGLVSFFLAAYLLYGPSLGD